MLPLLASLTRALPEGGRLALGGPDMEGEPLALSLSVKTAEALPRKVNEKGGVREDKGELEAEAAPLAEIEGKGEGVALVEVLFEGERELLGLALSEGAGEGVGGLLAVAEGCGLADRREGSAELEVETV